MNKKIISFSMWGDEPIYRSGMIHNSVLAKEIYPDWEVVVFIDSETPQDYKKKLIDNGCSLKLQKNRNGFETGYMWRFEAVDIEGCDYAIFRDADS